MKYFIQGTIEPENICWNGNVNARLWLTWTFLSTKIK
jgi:hypothetical protein